MCFIIREPAVVEEGRAGFDDGFSLMGDVLPTTPTILPASVSITEASFVPVLTASPTWRGEALTNM